MRQHDQNNKKVKEEYDWFEDPFNDEKNAQELQRAHSAQRRGCIIAVIIVLAAFVFLLVFGFLLF